MRAHAGLSSVQAPLPRKPLDHPPALLTDTAPVEQLAPRPAGLDVGVVEHVASSAFGASKKVSFDDAHNHSGNYHRDDSHHHAGNHNFDDGSCNDCSSNLLSDHPSGETDQAVASLKVQVT